MDERYARELFAIWHQGIVNQTVNLNVDARIELWLYKDHPALRPKQAKSIDLQVQMSLAGLAPKVERTTPSLVYQGSNAMNYAYLHAVGITMGRMLVHGYEDSSVISLGKRLAAVLDGRDEGLRSDMRESNRWAEMLGIREWFDWQPFEDMPASYLKMESS